VIAGYQGVSYRREVTTLGRGGSDTTAVAMAAALGAEWCEICSDVDGVYTADPRVVSTAGRIAALTYEETQELAEAGAKVLNAQAVEFAKEKGIAIYARATASALPGADPSSDGTVVRRHAPRMPGSVAGVASERDLLVLQVNGDATRVVSVLDECGVSGKQLHVAAFGGPSTSSGPAGAQSSAGRADGTTLVISRENLHNEGRLRRALTEAFGADARLIDGLGALSIIGTGINATYENVRRGLMCLEENGIQSFGLATSSFRATWLIDRTELDRAVRLLHALFIERVSP
jgi:aspartate kinase